MNKFQCPVCGTTVQIAKLDNSSNKQRTHCPNGHSVYRVWNGPENPAYDAIRPYGWTEWHRSMIQR